MKLTTLVAASCCMVALTPALSRAQDIFNFNSQPTDAMGFGAYPFRVTGPPPLNILSYAPATLTADNNPARTAVFSVSGSSAPEVSYQFQNVPAAFTGSKGTTYLANIDNNPGTVLTMIFNQPITYISLDFEVNNLTTNNVPDASLSLNGVTATGSFDPSSLNFEGALSYSGAPFTVATLSFLGTDDNGYAIDNILVMPAASAVPEPGIVALALAGLVPAASLLRRRRMR